MLDFEKAAQSGFKFHWPSINLRGCAFHFAQAVWRNFTSFGLKPKYSEDFSLKIWFKKIFALYLIPADQVENILERLIDEAPDYPGIQDFLDYFVSTWIEGYSSLV